jgi:tRNA pseudouridine13 synthase
MTSLPFLTAPLPGIGGRIKAVPEDFVVEEIHAYEPVGEGEHLFLRVEKRDLSAEDLVAHLSRTLRISRNEVGVAGLKDRRAVTRQYISVPATAEPLISQVDSERVRVLDARRHRNKLRSGHLRGNRFDILVREVAEEAASKAAAIAGVINQRGFPNYFGEQRFGRDGDTAKLGFDLLAGRRRPADLEPRRRRFLLRLALSAAQSAMFNAALAERINDHLLGSVLPGDVMQVCASGGCFVAEDAAVEQSRYDARETVLTGPLFGPRMKAATGVVAARELRVLDDFGITIAQLAAFEWLTPGSRRPFVVWPDDLRIDGGPNGVRFRFTLPSGCYATVLLREFCKTQSASGADEAEL